MGIRTNRRTEESIRQAANAQAAAAGRPPPFPDRPRRPTPTVPLRLVLEVDVPCHAPSEANLGGTLRAKLGRKAALKTAVAAALASLGTVPLPATVTLTRLGGKKLDTDNLTRSLKAARDVVSERLLGVDDADPRVRFRYRQLPAWGTGTRIRVEHRGGSS